MQPSEPVHARSRRRAGDGRGRIRTSGLLRSARIQQKMVETEQRLRDQPGITPAKIEHAQIEQTVREIFPKAPEEDVKAIMDRAFAEVGSVPP